MNYHRLVLEQNADATVQRTERYFLFDHKQNNYTVHKRRQPDFLQSLSKAKFRK